MRKDEAFVFYLMWVISVLVVVCVVIFCSRFSQEYFYVYNPQNPRWGASEAEVRVGCYINVFILLLYKIELNL